MNNAKSGALNETIKKEFGGIKKWMQKYRPDLQLEQSKILSEAIERERNQYNDKHNRILSFQQSSSQTPGVIEVDQFLSKTQSEFQDPRKFLKDERGNFIVGKKRSTVASGGIKTNLTYDKSLKKMCKSILNVSSPDYKTLKNVNEDTQEIIYMGISKDGLGRKGFLRERSKLFPQDKFNEPITSAQEVGWYSIQTNPYNKFETLDHHRRKHSFT